jgi:hypothetical protein
MKQVMKSGSGKKSAPARERGMEDGVCVLCGGELPGIPTKKDLAIAFARKIRQAFRMEPHHSVACRRCLPACLQKRAAFESEMRLSRIFALVLFAAVLAGGVYFGSFTVWTFLPAILGSAIILLLPYGKYFPEFPSA